jgi:inosine/xanthosine triphosphatase
MKIILGSTRAAKIEALRFSLNRIAEIDDGWEQAEIIALAVDTDAPAMPLSDEELMRGAKARAEAVREVWQRNSEAKAESTFFVGLEGGFHSINFENNQLTFLRGWAYVTDGKRGNFGASPSVLIPNAIVHLVVEGNRELGEVIDEIAGQYDVRSRQGTWGVLSRDLFTRAMSFETALIAAFAPFYNPKLYQSSLT